jgi:small subunit ribosomal protein S9
MAEQYYQTIGRRKTAIAQVRLYPGGTGKVTVNNRDAKDYFTTEKDMFKLLAPLREVGKQESVDITVRAVGGGINGQADAISLGIARALIKLDGDTRKALKANAFLTRDARKKERKKFGKRGARRSPQWRKR